MSVPGADLLSLLGARWRLGPRPYRAGAHRLEGGSDAQHAEIVEAAADNLHADRQALVTIAAIDRHDRLLRHVEGDSETDVGKGIERIVARRRKLGGKGRDLRS